MPFQFRRSGPEPSTKPAKRRRTHEPDTFRILLQMLRGDAQHLPPHPLEIIPARSLVVEFMAAIVVPETVRLDRNLLIR